MLLITNDGVRALFPEILMGIYSDLEINDVAESLGADESQVEMNEEGDIKLITTPVD